MTDNYWGNAAEFIWWQANFVPVTVLRVSEVSGFRLCYGARDDDGKKHAEITIYIKGGGLEGFSRVFATKSDALAATEALAERLGLPKQAFTDMTVELASSLR